MFGTTTHQQPEGAHAAAPAPLDLAELRALKERLVATVQAVEPGYDEVARVDALRTLEELGCVATALQARLAADLDASIRGQRAADGVPAREQGRGIGHQVALARREAPARGTQHLGLARIVRAELPHTWTAWSTGRITEWTATVIARETACLTLEHRLAVDEAVAGDADALEAMAVAEVIRACTREAARLDPASVARRRRHAEDERRVTLRPAPDTMTWLTALLPVKDGVAVHAALTRAADTARAGGDARTQGQVMADTLVGTVLTGAATGAAPGHPGNPGTKPAVPISLGVVMSDQTLFGGSDEPAHLDGYGPIPADLAAELLTNALTAQEKVWLRRLYTSPTTGELVAMDAKSRLFHGSLARYITLRDRFCRNPWCGAPIRHRDHVVAHADGGPTSGDNGQGTCESCNHAKQAPGWTARPLRRPGGGHEVQTTTPTGHRYHSRAPALARIHTRPPLVVDYYRAS